MSGARSVRQSPSNPHMSRPATAQCRFIHFDMQNSAVYESSVVISIIDTNIGLQSGRCLVRPTRMPVSSLVNALIHPPILSVRLCYGNISRGSKYLLFTMRVFAGCFTFVGALALDAEDARARPRHWIPSSLDVAFREILSASKSSIASLQ